MALKSADVYAVDQSQYTFLAVQVSPKPGRWNEATRERAQQVNADGVPVWLVECLRTDPKVNEATLVSVRIDAPRPPQVAGTSVQFENLQVRFWSITDRESGSLANSGMSISATGVQAIK